MPLGRPGRRAREGPGGGRGGAPRASRGRMGSTASGRAWPGRAVRAHGWGEAARAGPDGGGGGAARAGRARRALDPRRGGGRLPRPAAARQRGPPAWRTSAVAAMRGGGSAAPSRRCPQRRLTPGPWLWRGGVGWRPCRAELGTARHARCGADRAAYCRGSAGRGVIADHGRRR